MTRRAQTNLLGLLLLISAFTASGCEYDSSLSEINCVDDGQCPDEARCIEEICVFDGSDAGPGEPTDADVAPPVPDAETELDVQSDPDVATEPDVATDPDVIEAEESCDVDNGGCGDPAYFSCEDAQDGTVHCEPIDLCATDNGGCGDEDYYHCFAGEGQEPSCEPIDLCDDDNGGCGDEQYFTCSDGVAQQPSCEALAIVVDTTADSWGDSTTCSLRAAIEAVETESAVDGCAQGEQGDTVLLEAGQTYILSREGPPGVSPESGDLQIDSQLNLVAHGDEPATIDADHISRVLLIDDNGDVVVDGINFTGGLVDPGHGGAINNRGTLIVENSTIYANAALGSHGDLQGGGSGGGIYNLGNLTLIDTAVVENTAVGGHGQDVIDGRASGGGGGAGLGGGLFNSGALELSNTEVRDNLAVGGDGGHGESCPEGQHDGEAGNGGGAGGLGGSGLGEDGEDGNFSGGGGGGSGDLGNDQASSPGLGGHGGFGGGGGGAGPRTVGGDHDGYGEGGHGAGDGGTARFSCPAGGGGGAGIGGGLFNYAGQTTVDDATLWQANESTGGIGGEGMYGDGEGYDGDGIADEIFVYDGLVDCPADCSDLLVEY